MLPMWSVASAMRVSHSLAFCQRLRSNGCQSDTSPRIAPPVEALVAAATVARRVTWPRNARSPETCQSSSAATVTSMDTPAATARSLVTVSLVSPDLDSYSADITLDSRVQCQNCQEFGHTKVRCTKPRVEEDAGAGADGGGFDSVDAPVDGGDGGGDWNNNSGGGAGADWNASGGGGW